MSKKFILTFAHDFPTGAQYKLFDQLSYQRLLYETYFMYNFIRLTLVSLSVRNICIKYRAGSYGPMKVQEQRYFALTHNIQVIYHRQTAK